MAAMNTPSNPGPERFILGLALLVPLVIGALALAQLPGTSLASPTNLLLGDTSVRVASKRPAPSQPAPPPTLVPPTATTRPIATPQPTAAPATPTTQPATPTAEPTATPQRGARTYVVRKGDQLKYIAAQYQVSIWRIIATNDIPNPDSLRVGQVLTIPDN
jgi:LysM repeat protein